MTRTPLPGAEAPLQFQQPEQGEELARAETYGLLSRLWLAPPDDDLLARFRAASTPVPEGGGWLQAPWSALVRALRDTSAARAAAEYDALFGGVGKPEVFLFGSFYLTGFLNEKPLAALRGDLARLGLTRDETRSETEDHVAYVFEVMRYLIAGDDPAVCHLEQQRQFFRAHLQPWVEKLCDAVADHPSANIWRQVAQLTRAFVQVETQAFDMIE